jgi:integrase
MPLGDAAIVSLAKARKAATELYAKVKLGGDPAGERIESQERAGDTMFAALAAFMPYQETRLRPLSLKQVKRHLLKHCRPLHSLPLAKIDRRTVSKRMASIATKNGPVESNRVRSSLAACFEWRIREGWTENNPADGGNRAPERSRERVLSDAELRAIWQATDDNSDYSAILRLLLLTACRVSEIGSLRWSEVRDGAIELPAGRVKNKHAHRIPLAPMAAAILYIRVSNFALRSTRALSLSCLDFARSSAT